jgi:hypothetical protein
MPYSDLLDPSRVRPLLIRARAALACTQKQLGSMMSLSGRTIMRFEGGRSTPARFQIAALARLVHPTDPALASELAAAAGKTLVELGLETASPPKTPTLAHLVDSVLCAGAEAAAVPPQVMRAGLEAVFDRMAALDVTPAQMAEALGKGKKKRPK